MKKYLFPILLGAVLLFLMSSCSHTEVEEEEPLSELNNNNASEIESDEQQSEDQYLLPNEWLQKGDKGETVQLLQNVLIEIGYPLEQTGTFDRETVWALTDIQLQLDHINVTGMYDEAMKDVLELIISNEKEIVASSALAWKEDEVLNEETVLIHNPYEILVLVNKQNALPSDYIPEDLVFPSVKFPFVEDLPKKQMREVAARALEKMFTAIEKEGLELFAQSGYRSFDRQSEIFTSHVNTHGEEHANTFSARPGESEHQTGLTMDVTSPKVDYALVSEFGETDEGIWLEENAADYGFIIRYPKGKEEITQYQYEPWHLRYVGKKAAKEITEQGITLEEYLGEH